MVDEHEQGRRGCDMTVGICGGGESWEMPFFEEFDQLDIAMEEIVKVFRGQRGR